MGISESNDTSLVESKDSSALEKEKEKIIFNLTTRRLRSMQRTFTTLNLTTQLRKLYVLGKPSHQNQRFLTYFNSTPLHRRLAPQIYKVIVYQLLLFQSHCYNWEYLEYSPRCNYYFSLNYPPQEGAVNSVRKRDGKP